MLYGIECIDTQLYCLGFLIPYTYTKNPAMYVTKGLHGFLYIHKTLHNYIQIVLLNFVVPGIG